MQKINSVQHLSNDSRNILLATSHLCYQLSSFNVLHKQKYMILIIKMSIQFDYVWMRKIVKYLQFKSKLILHVVVSDHRLEYLFQVQDHSCLSMSADIHLPKFT